MGNSSAVLNTQNLYTPYTDTALNTCMHTILLSEYAFYFACV